MEELKESIGGAEIGQENYSMYADFDIIKKEFDIKEIELENETGIIGAVYNRIALKDLK